MDGLGRSSVLGLAIRLATAAVASSEEPVVASVEVIVEDVFDNRGRNESAPEFWAYRLANRVHIDTRESIIRQELLFLEGQPLSEEALAQTERNLRALRFVRSVRIERTPDEDGGVHLKVITSDSWTTIPVFHFAKVGNQWTWAAGGAERNLLGYGKELELFRTSNLDRDETLLYYRDPRVRGSRTSASLLASNASDGHQLQLAALRPFYSLATRWSFRAQLEDFDRLDPIFDGGERIERLRHLRRRAEVDVARAVRRTGGSALRMHLGYDFTEDDIDQRANVRRFGMLRAGVSAVQHRFIKPTHINRFERPEDVNLGFQGSAFVGVSTPWLGGESGTTSFLFLDGGRGLSFHPNGFLMARASWHARRRRDRLESSLLFARLNVVQKLARNKVLMAKAEMRYGHRLDPEIQLRLGAESGLRGYPVRQFNGDRSALLSAEGRWFVAENLAEIGSIGFAAFLDSGFAWSDGEPMVLSDLRTNVGVSLLLGSSRSSASRPGVRIDFAYALDPVEGRGPWLISAGSRIGF